MRTNTSEPVEGAVKVATIMFSLLCLCHYTACAWFGVATTDTAWSEPSSGVVSNWVDNMGLGSESHFFCYIVAFHWSITQFTPATNNVVPISVEERVFSILAVLTGFVSFSFFMATMFSTLNQLKTFKASRVRERQRLMQFVRSKRIPASLAQRVLMLFEADLETKEDCHVESDIPILGHLPESIRIRVCREYCLPLLLKNQLLGSFHQLDCRC